MRRMDKIIYEYTPDKCVAGPVPTGLLIQEWNPLSEPLAVLTLVVTGRNVAGIILKRDEVEDLTKHLIAWIGNNNDEHTAIKEAGNSVHAGANSLAGPGRPA